MDFINPSVGITHSTSQVNCSYEAAHRVRYFQYILLRIDANVFQLQVVTQWRCVNTVNWSENGDLLVSGSDDTRVCIWDYRH